MLKWLLLFPVLAVVGCGIMGVRSPARIEVGYVSGTELTVDSQSVPLAKLPEALRAQGATAQTEIAVGVPADAPQGVVAAIGGKLASAGFRKIVFTRPRQATAYVDGPKPATPKRRVR